MNSSNQYNSQFNNLHFVARSIVQPFNRCTILILFSLFLSTTVFAQPTTNPQPPEIKTDKIDVVKSYEPILQDAEKITFQPDGGSGKGDPNSGQPGTGGPGTGTGGPGTGAGPSSGSRPYFNNYDVPNRFLTMTYQPTKLKPIAWRPDRNKQNFQANQDNYNFWLKAGYGVPHTIFGDIAAVTNQQQWGYVGFNANHINTNGKEDFKDYMRSGGTIFARNYLEIANLDYNVSYDRDQFHYYGFDRSDTTLNYTNDDLRLVYNNVGASVALTSNSENTADVRFKATGKYNRYFDKRKIKENNIALAGDAGKMISEIAELGGFAKLWFTNHKDSSATNTFSANITPRLKFLPNIGNFSLGASALLVNKDLKAFPYLNMEVFIIPDRFTFYGGWNKELLPNNFMTLSQENPFLNQYVDYRNSFRENRFGGFKGTVNEMVSYDLRFAQTLTEQQPLYLNKADDPKTFIVVYDSLLNTLSGHAELGLTLNKFIEVGVDANYFHYTLNNQEAAWHLPTFRLGTHLRVSPMSKLLVTADLFAWNKTPARTAAGDYELIKGTVDVNAGVKYQVVDNFAVFANVNNIVSTKYRRYLQYPSYGINGLAGIMLRF